MKFTFGEVLKVIQNKPLTGTSEKSAQRALAHRVATGSQLTASPKLRQLFLYVVDCAVREHPEEATEQQIGVKIFGRRPGYSSGDDSIVRSQARLLRLKLKTHFETDGAHEALVVDIPKGHYLPVFHERDPEQHPEQHPAQLSERHPERPSSYQDVLEAVSVPSRSLPEQPTPLALPMEAPFAVAAPSTLAAAHRIEPAQTKLFASRTISRPFVTLLLILLLTFGAALGWLGRQLWTAAQAPVDNALWAPFLHQTRPTLVIFSNPLFRGSPSSGLHLIDPSTPSPNSPRSGAQEIEADDDTYTGTGEAAAVHDLTRFFDARDATFLLKRSRLVTWDEARSGNLIFVGAPSQNTALHDLPTLSEFNIALDAAHHGFIVNQHPRPGEPAQLPPNDKTQETAILALLPGLEPDTHMIIFSGLTTIGTQMAVEYACHPENIAFLQQRLGLPKGDLPPFEAVLQIGVSKGVGVSTKLLMVHRH